MGPDLEGPDAEKMIMGLASRLGRSTSGDAMAGMREKYGSGVVGLPFAVRTAITAAVTGPSIFWLLVSWRLAMQPSPWTALTLAIAVLFATPAYLVLPSLWERTTESVRTDWRSASLERRLQTELRGDAVEHAPRIEGRSRPPTRW